MTFLEKDIRNAYVEMKSLIQAEEKVEDFFRDENQNFSFHRFFFSISRRKRPKKNIEKRSKICKID